MVRLCCIPFCPSGAEAPRHSIPKNIKRRKLWLDALGAVGINPLEHVIDKMTVCYRHFKDTDYSCCATKRFLKSDVIPSIMLLAINENISTTSASTSANISHLCKYENYERYTQYDAHRKYDDAIVQLTAVQEEQQQSLEQQQQLLEQQRQSLGQQRQSLGQQQQPLQQQYQSLEQQQQTLQKQQEELDKLKLKMAQQQNKKYYRSDLDEIKRQNLLSPRCKKIYTKIVHIRKENRRLRRNFRKMVKQCRTSKENEIKETETVQEQFINMIKRNKNIAPQVKIQ